MNFLYSINIIIHRSILYWIFYLCEILYYHSLVICKYCFTEYSDLPNVGTFHHKIFKKSHLLISPVIWKPSNTLLADTFFSKILIFTLRFEFYFGNKCCLLFALKWQAHFNFERSVLNTWIWITRVCLLVKLSSKNGVPWKKWLV